MAKVQWLGAVLNDNLCQSGTTVERAVVHYGYCFGNCDACEPGAVGECLFPNSCNGVEYSCLGAVGYALWDDKFAAVWGVAVCYTYFSIRQSGVVDSIRYEIIGVCHSAAQQQKQCKQLFDVEVFHCLNFGNLRRKYNEKSMKRRFCIKKS